MSMTYTGTGVDHGAMDPVKRAAQLEARTTARNLERFGFVEFEPSRGESVYLIEMPDCFIGHVEEGLGTKNKVADAMFKLTGRSYDDAFGQCAVAMIVNDGITLGVMPLSLAMHMAAGHKSWFENEERNA